MARCMSCHLERQLGPLPVQGTNHLGPQVCPKCSKDIDRSLGVLEVFGLTVMLPIEVAEGSGSTEGDAKKPRKAK